MILCSRNKLDKKADNSVNLIDYEDLKEIKGDVIINTTPVGMYPNIDASPVGEDIIENFNYVVDVVYNPLKTKFMQIGEGLNKKICGGIEMLIMQGLKSEEIWNDFNISKSDIDKIITKLKKEI